MTEVKEKIDPTVSAVTNYIGLEHIRSNGKLLGIGSSNDVKSTKTAFKKNDVLYGKLRPYLNKHIIVDFDGVCSTDILAYRNPSLVAAKFFNFWLNLDSNIQSINAESKGINLPRVSALTINSLIIPFPPEEELNEIVNKLESLFGQLDQLRTRLEKIPELLKQFRQAVLTQAVTGKLTAEWAAKNSYTPVQNKIQEISQPIRPSRHKSKTTSIIPGKFALSVGKPELDIPDRFLWIELVDVARLETGHTPSRKHPEYWEPGDVCWIGIKDASDNHSKTIVDTYQKTNHLGLANSAARLLPEGTVCLSRTASVGYVVKMGRPMATSQDFVNWVCTDAIDPDWLKWLLVAEEESIWNFGKGTTHKTVYFPEVIAFHVALPPIEEQREIVRRIESLFVVADRIESNYKTLQEKIEELPQAILSKAFRGELVGQETEKELHKYNEQLGKMEMAAEP